MVLENIISSPHRRSQNGSFSPPAYKKQYTKGEELGSCLTLVQRHRFLLTALVLLFILCTVYLYFAVTLGAPTDTCLELTGSKKALCITASVAKGKLKFF